MKKLVGISILAFAFSSVIAFAQQGVTPEFAKTFYLATFVVPSWSIVIVDLNQEKAAFEKYISDPTSIDLVTMTSSQKIVEGYLATTNEMIKTSQVLYENLRTGLKTGVVNPEILAKTQEGLQDSLAELCTISHGAQTQLDILKNHLATAGIDAFTAYDLETNIKSCKEHGL